MMYENIANLILTIAEVILAAGTVGCLVRAIVGPKTSDRLVAVNMTGTQVICLVCLIAARTGQTGFTDIAIIYALLSFLAVVVLTKILSGKGQDK